MCWSTALPVGTALEGEEDGALNARGRGSVEQNAYEIVGSEHVAFTSWLIKAFDFHTRRLVWFCCQHSPIRFLFMLIFLSFFGSCL